MYNYEAERSHSCPYYYLELGTFSIIFAKPGLMADALLILALHSCPSLWLIQISVFSLWTNRCLWSWASQDLVWHFTPRQFMNAYIASWMALATHAIWFLSVGDFIPKALRADCIVWFIEAYQDVLCFVISITWLSVRSRRSRSSFNYPAGHAPVCWPLPCNSEKPNWS